MNMESNNISQSRRKGRHNLVVAFHACFVTGSLLCKGATVQESAGKQGIWRG